MTLYWRVVGRGRRQVVDHREVAVPATEVADLHANPRHQLVLDACLELPVVRPLVPSMEHRRIGHRAGDRLAEPRVAHGPALPVRQRIQEIALRDVVAVDAQPATVVPRSGHQVGHRVDRIAQVRVVAGQTLGQDVAAQVDLEGRLPAAEQVVDGPEPWGNVVPAQVIVCRKRDVPIGHERRRPRCAAQGN